MLRAAQTALPIRRRFDRSLAAIWPIQEFTYLAPALCVGTSSVERKPRIDAYWDRLDPAYVDGPGAESFSDLLVRARTFLAQVREAQTPFNVLVSHGQFMQALHVLIDKPDIHDQDAIGVFRTQQSARPFANCERLTIDIAACGEVRAVRD